MKKEEKKKIPVKRQFSFVSKIQTSILPLPPSPTATQSPSPASSPKTPKLYLIKRNQFSRRLRQRRFISRAAAERCWVLACRSRVCVGASPPPRTPASHQTCAPFINERLHASAREESASACACCACSNINSRRTAAAHYTLITSLSEPVCVSE